jgi:hypothetical protein
MTDKAGLWAMGYGQIVIPAKAHGEGGIHRKGSRQNQFTSNFCSVRLIAGASNGFGRNAT